MRSRTRGGQPEHSQQHPQPHPASPCLSPLRLNPSASFAVSASFPACLVASASLLGLSSDICKPCRLASEFRAQERRGAQRQLRRVRRPQGCSRMASQPTRRRSHQERRSRLRRAQLRMPSQHRSPRPSTRSAVVPSFHCCLEPSTTLRKTISRPPQPSRCSLHAPGDFPQPLRTACRGTA